MTDETVDEEIVDEEPPELEYRIVYAQTVQDFKDRVKDIEMNGHPVSLVLLVTSENDPTVRQLRFDAQFAGIDEMFATFTGSYMGWAYDGCFDYSATPNWGALEIVR